MKRLTERVDGSTGCALTFDLNVRLPNMDQMEMLQELILRLFEYENAIFSPDGITDIPLDRLTEICNAERDGRCVVLPCKENAVVYRVTDDWSCDSDCWGDTCCDCAAACKKKSREVTEGRFSVLYDSKEFGKTVFHTREEAESALKVGKTNE